MLERITRRQNPKFYFEIIQQHSRRDSETSSIANEEFEIGQLNSGKRIDYQVSLPTVLK